MKAPRTTRRAAPGIPDAGVRARRAPALSLVAPHADLDSVRWPRVRTARERIDSGYYEREDVQHLVVNALLNELRRG